MRVKSCHENQKKNENNQGNTEIPPPTKKRRNKENQEKNKKKQENKQEKPGTKTRRKTRKSRGGEPTTYNLPTHKTPKNISLIQLADAHTTYC